MNKRILLIDDDETTRQVVTAVLEMNGYEVISFPDCYNIIEKVSEIQPSLVLMDIWLKGPGGEYASRTLKNDPLTAEIPVVLFSGEEEMDAVVERVGAEGAIRKPFDMLELASKLEQFMCTPAQKD